MPYPQLKQRAIVGSAFGAIRAVSNFYYHTLGKALMRALMIVTLVQIPLSAHYSLVLADEQTTPEQFAALRAMTGVRRLQLAEQLYWSARKMKAAGLRYQHPDWSEQCVNDEVRRVFTKGADE
jgi:hypothetical protein